PVDHVARQGVVRAEDVDRGVDQVNQVMARASLRAEAAGKNHAFCRRECGAVSKKSLAISANELAQPALNAVVKRARAGEMREQIFHLVGEHAATLQEDVLG